MKLFILLFLTFIVGSFSAQVVPYVDFNNFFKSRDGNTFRMIEMQPIKEYKGGDNLVAYIDIRGNLRIYNGEDKTDLSNMNVEYQVSDNLLAWSVGTTLSRWDNGKKDVLSFFGGDYIVKDDIIVFTDVRYYTSNVYWKGQTYQIQSSTSMLELSNSNKIGENIMAFADNGNLYRIFYKGETYEVGVWYGDINFQAGTDIIAFNDPTTRTFAVFEDGNFVDVEQQWVNKYQAGRGFIAYENQNGDLMIYENGKTSLLASFPQKWEVKDDIVFYEANGFSYIYQMGVKTQAANYKIEEYKMKNATFVYKNMQGGVSAVSNGKLTDITNLQNAEYDIYGNTVIVKAFNNSFFFLTNGVITRE